MVLDPRFKLKDFPLQVIVANARIKEVQSAYIN